MTNVAFAPDSAEWLADPYVTYGELRVEDPVHWSEELGHWVLTRYQDVVAVLKDGRFSAANRMPQRRWDRPTTMVTADPPDHARLRRPATRRFSAASVDGLRPRVQEIVDGLIEAAETRGRLDIVHDLGRPLPRAVIAEMLGLPHVAASKVERSRDEAHGTSTGRAVPLATGTVMPGERIFKEALARHREELQDDLLGDLLKAEAGREMSAEEVLDSAVILYGAGQETTAKMISNGLYHLLRDPRELQKLRDDPALIGPAAEELLRFDGPVQGITRRASEDVVVGDSTVKAGDKVLCLIAAANRDPAAFEAADDLRIDRADNAHVAFGSGMHACLGATLARVEIQAAIGTLVARFPELSLAGDDVEWEGSFIIRGLKTLPVDLGVSR